MMDNVIGTGAKCTRTIWAGVQCFAGVFGHVFGELQCATETLVAQCARKVFHLQMNVSNVRVERTIYAEFFFARRTDVSAVFAVLGQFVGTQQVDFDETAENVQIELD